MYTFAEQPKATKLTMSTKSTIASRTYGGQSHVVNSTLHLQRSIGNQGLQRLQHVIQPKLTVGPAGDMYEQEADRVASHVVEQIHGSASTDAKHGQLAQRQQEPDEKLQVKSILQYSEVIDGEKASPDLASAINRARGGGQPLDAGLKQSMGQVMGADFSGVQVHTDGQADQLNQSIQAKAFTTGRDVFFRQGAYQPGSRGGQKLIAHEMTHIMQQNGGVVVQRAPADPLPAATTATPVVTPDQVTVTNNGTGVTADAIQVLQEIVAALGETSVTITSGRRTPSEQAAAMYTNLEVEGVAVGKNRYGPSGEKVIDVYVAGKAATPAKDADTIRQEMTDKINELGPEKVSNHCSNNTVIDVAPTSITNDAQFQTKAAAHQRVTKYLGPATDPEDPAHHLEIK